MHRRSGHSAAAVVAAFGLIGASTLNAQWLKYPTAGVPQKADGMVDLSAPAPRIAGGKPDFSGIWLTGNPLCGQAFNPVTYTCGVELPMGREGINMGAALPGGLPYQPWLAALVKERTANNAKDDPHVGCLPDTFLRAYSLPHFVRFVQTPGLLVDPERDERQLPAGVPRWPAAARRSHALVAGLLVREMGRRHARHRIRTVFVTTSGSIGMEA